MPPFSNGCGNLKMPSLSGLSQKKFTGNLLLGCPIPWNMSVVFVGIFMENKPLGPGLLDLVKSYAALVILECFGFGLNTIAIHRMGVFY